MSVEDKGPVTGLPDPTVTEELLPKGPTRAAVSFLVESYHFSNFEIFLLQSAATLYQTMDLKLTESKEVARTSDVHRRWLESLKTPKEFIRLLDWRTHQPLFAELLLCRVVDNYLTYIADL